jgi:uncharacterized damage-inducible protein DinB
MNSLAENEFGFLKETMALKDQLWAILQDEHLSKSLGGNTKSLGEVCKQQGEVQQGYINSFRTFKHDWTYKHADANVASSVAALRAWNEKLDADLFAAMESLSNEDIESKTIDRGGFTPNPKMQLHVFREGILIFAAKVSIYLRALNIEFPEQWKYWIS